MNKYTKNQDYLNNLFGNIYNGEALLVQNEMAHSLLSFILDDSRSYSIPIRPQSVILGSLKNPVLRALFSPRLNFKGFVAETEIGSRIELVRLSPEAKPEQLNYASQTMQNWFEELSLTASRDNITLHTLKDYDECVSIMQARLEELDERNPQDIDERVVENSIVQNVKNFILTFGKDFTYVGHQVHIEKLEHDMWVDLLFYNRELQSLVVVELKKGEFKPAYLGQLSAYMRVLNDDERKANENPVIGIILCKGADKSFVEYLLQDYNQPMGVATYKVMPEKLKAVMPDEKMLLEVM